MWVRGREGDLQVCVSLLGSFLHSQLSLWQALIPRYFCPGAGCPEDAMAKLSQALLSAGDAGNCAQVVRKVMKSPEKCLQLHKAGAKLVSAGRSTSFPRKEATLILAM